MKIVSWSCQVFQIHKLTQRNMHKSQYHKDSDNSFAMTVFHLFLLIILMSLKFSRFRAVLTQFSFSTATQNFQQIMIRADLLSTQQVNHFSITNLILELIDFLHDTVRIGFGTALLDTMSMEIPSHPLLVPVSL